MVKNGENVAKFPVDLSSNHTPAPDRLNRWLHRVSRVISISEIQCSRSTAHLFVNKHFAWLPKLAVSSPDRDVVGLRSRSFEFRELDQRHIPPALLFFERLPQARQVKDP